MPWAVEMFFDPEADAVVRAVWKALRQHGLHKAPPPQAARPHVSLAVWEQLDIDSAESALLKFCKTMRPISLQFESIGIFGAANVLYFAPTVTQPLLRLHDHFHRCFQVVSGIERHYYLPGNWTPHCTIAESLDRHDLPAAVQSALQTNLPFSAQITSLGLAQYPGAKLLAEFPVSDVLRDS